MKSPIRSRGAPVIGRYTAGDELDRINHVETVYKIALVVVLLVVIFSLGQALFFMMTDKDDDKDKAVATRKRMLDMLAADKLFVASFHMPFPGIGFIEKGQGGYRWVPHSYQLNL